MCLPWTVYINKAFSTKDVIVNLGQMFGMYIMWHNSRGRRSFMLGEGDSRTAPTHPVFDREQRQRPTASSMWFTFTSVDVGGTDWTAGQHQSTGLQRTRSTDTAGHTWTGQWRLQSSSCPVWIHRGQDQQEQRLHLFNRRSSQTQTCLPVGRKSDRDCYKSTLYNKWRCWYISELPIGLWR